MSNGDEEPEDGGPGLGVEEFEARLDDARDAVDAAGTEADLDAVEATLDDVEADLEEADLPDAEEEEESPREALAARLSELREDLEAERGPYAEDVVETVESARSTVTGTRWTEAGEADLVAAVRAFLDAVEDALDATAEFAGETPDDLAETLGTAAAAVEAADLDPDEDAGTIAPLVEAADDLAAAVDDAEEWDDLTVRQQLQAEGFYEVLGRKHKDYPPEWSALKEWEKRDDAGMVLLLLDRMGDQGFMEEHCLDALARMGNPDATEEMLARAEKRSKPAIRILGKIGEASDEVLDTIEEYAETESDPQLQRTTLKALGEMGAVAAIRTVADQLAVEDDSVRSTAARALGMIGDTRAIEPLADVLAGDDSEPVRASAAWALVQVGTGDALRAAAEYADDRSFVVQAEAEVAEAALAAEATA